MNALTHSEVFTEMEMKDVLEDRREYDYQMLKDCYPDLSDLEVAKLYVAIQDHFDPYTPQPMEVSLETIEKAKPADVQKALDFFFVEGAHNNFDGYGAYQKLTIYTLLADFAENLKYIQTSDPA